MRFFRVAASDDQAIREAREWLRPFIARMKVTTGALQPEWTPWFDLDRLIEASLIGTISSIRQKVARIASAIPVVSLGLKQLMHDIDARETQLQLLPIRYSRDSANLESNSAAPVSGGNPHIPR